MIVRIRVPSSARLAKCKNIVHFSHTQIQKFKFLKAPQTCIFIEDRQHSEYKSTECGCKVSSPVVSHRKVCGCYLDTEQHACEISEQQGRNWSDW